MPDGLDGRHRTANKPAAGDGGSANAPRELLLPPPTPSPDEGIDPAVGEHTPAPTRLTPNYVLAAVGRRSTSAIPIPCPGLRALRSGTIATQAVSGRAVQAMTTAGMGGAIAFVADQQPDVLGTQQRHAGRRTLSARDALAGVLVHGAVDQLPVADRLGKRDPDWGLGIR